MWRLQRLLYAWLIGLVSPLVAEEPWRSDRELAGDLARIEAELTALPELVPSTQTHQRIGFHGLAVEEGEPWVVVDLGERVVPERVVIFPARLPVADPEALSPGFPRGLAAELSDEPDFSAPILLSDWEEASPGEGVQVPFVAISGNGASGRYLRVRVTALRDDYFHLGEIVVLADGQNVALKRPVSSSAAIENPRRWERMNLTDGNLWCLTLRGQPVERSHGFLSATRTEEVVADEAWVEVDLGKMTPFDEIHLVPAHPRDFPDSAGFGFPPRFWVLSDVGTPDEVELLRETDPPYPAEALPNPGAVAVKLAPENAVARRIRVQCETLWRLGPQVGSKRNEFLYALSELQVWHAGKNLALGATVTASDASDLEGWSPEGLIDGASSRYELLDWSTWLGAIVRAEFLQTRIATITTELNVRAERSRERIVTWSIAAALLTATLATIVLLVQRSRSIRSREALRAQIARDLHDEIGASLSHLAMQSDLAQDLLREDALQPGRLEKISTTARGTLDHMRDVIWMLAPRGADDDWSALSERLVSISERLLEGVAHDVTVLGEPPEVERGHARPIQRARELVAFLKESLTNARKHSEASQITVEIDWRGGTLRLQIADDGVGFDPARARAHSSGAGLGNLQNRADALGATFDLASRPEHGTTITLTVPL